MRGLQRVAGGLGRALGARGRVWLSAGLLGLGSLWLFAASITRQSAIYFDETHYVPAARALLARTGGVNIEHPLFAKTLIAGSIAAFGDNALAWRLPSLVMGVGGVLALFAIALMLFRDLRCAWCAALLLVFDQTHFIQARIAMLDMVMIGCVLAGAACWLAAEQGGDGRAERWWSLGGAVLLGLAVGAKWLAAPYVGLFLAMRLWWRWRESGRDGGVLVDRLLPDAGTLAGVALLVYFATFWPAFF